MSEHQATTDHPAPRAAPPSVHEGRQRELTRAEKTRVHRRAKSLSDRAYVAYVLAMELEFEDGSLAPDQVEFWEPGTTKLKTLLERASREIGVAHLYARILFP